MQSLEFLTYCLQAIDDILSHMAERGMSAIVKQRRKSHRNSISTYSIIPRQAR
jgi:hypothetical protein